MQKVPFLSVNASRDKDGSKLFIVVVNKNLDKGIETNIILKDFIHTKKGKAWILNGPSVNATNEIDHNNVKISSKDFLIDKNSFNFTFEPHSLTAVEIEAGRK